MVHVVAVDDQADNAGEHSARCSQPPAWPATWTTRLAAPWPGSSAAIPTTRPTAADPALVPVLVGLGFRELSCPPRAIPPVRDAVRAQVASDAKVWEKEQDT